MSFILIRVISNVGLLAIVALMSACGSPSVPTLVGHRLTGTVMQQTANGLVPRAGISVQETSQRRGATTDARGRYTIAGLPDGVAHIRIDFSIFEPIDRDIQITSDTVADFQLIPRPLVALSGRITEMTAGGPVPVPAALVEVVFCSRPNGKYEVNDAVTDAEGLYRIDGLCEGPAMVFVNKAGYTYTSPNTPHCDDGHGTECRWVTISGDTRFDLVIAGGSRTTARSALGPAASEALRDLTRSGVGMWQILQHSVQDWPDFARKLGTRFAHSMVNGTMVTSSDDARERRMSVEERFDRIDSGIAAVNRKLHDIGDRVTSLETGQTELVTTATGIDRRLTKVEVTQEAMRDDIKLLAEGLVATNAAIERSTDRVIAYIDERISPIEQAVRHLSR